MSKIDKFDRLLGTLLFKVSQGFRYLGRYANTLAINF